MAGANTLEFTDANFEAEVLKSQQPVLVDFWADWCTPCKMLTPTIDALAGKYVGRVKVGKVDVTVQKQVSAQYQIMSIPTVLLFKNGQIVKAFRGFTNEATLATAIDAALG